jgi:hypothetical protein
MENTVRHNMRGGAGQKSLAGGQNRISVPRAGIAKRLGEAGAVNRGGGPAKPGGLRHIYGIIKRIRRDRA